MKSMLKCWIFLILLLGIILPTHISAQVYTKQREISRSFRVNSGSVVQVANKYGNINVIPWQKDSVRVEINLKVQGKQVAKVDKIMASIDFELMSFGNYINARTTFRDNQATFWKDVVSYAGQVINTSNNLQIDYIIYMPASTDLKIDNKFGNIYTDSHTGKVDIKIANGDLQARDFSGNLKLEIEFGSATLKTVNSAELIVNYSDLSLSGATAIILNSRSSTLDIEEVRQLEINSQRDKVNIRECHSINGESYFSKVKIGMLESSATLATKYGELKLNSVLKGFRMLHLTSEYTDILINMDALTTCSLDLTYDAKTRLTLLPALSNNLKKEVLNPQVGKVNATGNIGRNPASQVYVNTKAGSLTIFNK
jgi:hypothetical protein